jgi:hypothetical protein
MVLVTAPWASVTIDQRMLLISLTLMTNKDHRFDLTTATIDGLIDLGFLRSAWRYDRKAVVAALRKFLDATFPTEGPLEINASDKRVTPRYHGDKSVH